VLTCMFKNTAIMPHGDFFEDIQRLMKNTNPEKKHFKISYYKYNIMLNRCP